MNQAQQQEAAINFQKIVLQAWHDVDNALTAYKAEQTKPINQILALIYTLLALANWIGRPIPSPVTLNPRDKRFTDKTWADNPAFYSLRLSYQAFADYVDELVSAAQLEPIQEAKARLTAGLAVDALAPTNYLPTNPAALKRAFETGGASLAKGLRNFVDDLMHNDGRPRQVDTSGFTLGQNLAATPGQVVFRNDLMELIQYAPQTDQVHATPMLCSPPWINKYYVMDLAPDRSFIEWAVRHERTVFAISYRNPSADMSGITLDDYLIHGPQQALDVIGEITGAPVTDIVGLCLGGALTAITDSWLAAGGDDRQPGAFAMIGHIDRERHVGSSRAARVAIDTLRAAIGTILGNGLHGHDLAGSSVACRATLRHAALDG